MFLAYLPADNEFLLPVSFLVASMTQSQQTIASLQFDLDVERGRIADFEARLEDVEDSNDVRDASLILVKPFLYLLICPKLTCYLIHRRRLIHPCHPQVNLKKGTMKTL